MAHDDTVMKVLGVTFAAGITIFAAFVTLVCISEFTTPPLAGWSPMEVFTGRAGAVMVTAFGWVASGVIWWVVIKTVRGD